MHYADIAIAAPLHTPFTYRVPEGMHISPGMRVEVPFRRKRAIGLCLEMHSKAPDGVDESRIRPIDALIDDEPSASEKLLKLIRWISSYYCAPIGEVCRAALPVRLMKHGVPKTTRPTEPMEIEPLPQQDVELNCGQREALDAIVRSLGGEAPNVTLIDGITGSGKTEIYLRLFEKLVADGKQGLLLVPEIGLTPQLTGRAAARFCDRVAVYHSGLTDAQRHAQWLRMRRGEIDVVIGTRSALFAPLARLGAIVVDEEHDASFKQDDGVAYHGRDAAVMRAHIEGCPAVLGSATPSLESLENARKGKYRICRLTERPTGAPLPTVEIVDMRRDRRRPSPGPDASEGERRARELGALSPQLFDAIAEALARGEQVLLFAGRRGFAGSLQCDNCGEAVVCPNCDIALTPHRSQKAGRRGESALDLTCHYCDYAICPPAQCPICSIGELIPIGHGTERLEAEIADFFPNARIARLDSDSAASPKERRKILGDMRRGKIDILVGTQMVTKGHDFPGITLVGVVSADVSLHIPDFRAAERTFQLLTQVAGRAGRGAKAGRVIIQTRQPEHPSLVAAREHDPALFASGELEHRRELSYPPFSRVANLRFSSTREERAAAAAADAAKIATKLQRAIAQHGSVSILGPAPAPFAKLRGRHRWQILIKASSSALLGKFAATIRPVLEKAMPPAVRFSIDVDPTNML